MKKPTQKQRVIGKLKRDKFITRNECLQNHITRLGAIINELNKDGWELVGEYDEKGDYVYTLKASPIKKIVYKVDGLDKEIVIYK